MITPQKYRAGDVLSEAEIFVRIHQAVQSILELGGDEISQLHNLVCDGDVTIYEDKKGNPLDAGGEPIKNFGSEPWIYVFTKDE